MATEPSGFEEIRREGFQRLVLRVIAAHAKMMPIPLVVCLIIAWSELAPWRRWGILGIAVTIIGAGFAERRQVQRLAELPISPAAAQVVSMVGFMCLVGPLTGGILSPFAVQLSYSAALWAFVATRGVSGLAIGLTAAVIAGCALVAGFGDWFMPSGFIDGAGRLTRTYLFSLAAMQAAALFLGRDAGRNLRDMSDDMLRRSLQIRDDMLQMYADRTRDLTTLSGEIAHELKNPLASLKGLTSLVELDPARASERVAVMKGEIERMQSILQDFLNFARPLAPLQCAEVDLRELAGEVVFLHEGLAVGQGVQLALEPGAPLSLPCDARKVKQALINLVQNALEASSDGGSIAIALGAAGPFGWVRVSDRGAGLAPQLGDGEPRPGTTTKAHGSGIGLTVVRALVEQHGGRFHLANRDGGGCVAELALPLEGAVAGASAG